EKQRSDCLIVGVYEGRKLSAPAEAVDQATGGYLAAVLKRGDMEGKLASTLLLQSVPGVASERILLVGLGKEREFDEKHYRQAIKASVKALNNSAASDAVTYLAELPVKKHGIDWKAAHY